MKKFSLILVIVIILPIIFTACTDRVEENADQENTDQDESVESEEEETEESVIPELMQQLEEEESRREMERGSMTSYQLQMNYSSDTEYIYVYDIEENIYEIRSVNGLLEERTDEEARAELEEIRIYMSVNEMRPLRFMMQESLSAMNFSQGLIETFYNESSYENEETLGFKINSMPEEENGNLETFNLQMEFFEEEDPWNFSYSGEGAEIEGSYGEENDNHSEIIEEMVGEINLSAERSIHIMMQEILTYLEIESTEVSYFDVEADFEENLVHFYWDRIEKEETDEE
ncbi:hypothetical protein [Halalkalibacillus halophilus]|uniref:hypothetical protein n=1 Tax=Halalkalibacillus halophilus TaxID=392827 RepID=UPI0003FFCFE9|nr:hypothetical protein [Halalkalibacillus halophilus]